MDPSAVSEPLPNPLPSPLKDRLLKGMTGNCPSCGQGKLFSSYLKVVPQCATCGEEYHHHRADDMPAYFVILIVGHVIVLAATSVEVAFQPPYWVHAVIWLPLTLTMTLALLQPVKGIIVALQWHLGLHGFKASKQRRDFIAAPATTPVAQAD